MTQRIIETPWADTGAITDPGGAKTATGWIAEIPTHQNFNWLLNRADEAIQNNQETGIEPWHALVIFQDQGLTMGSDGIVYQSQQGSNLNNQPVADDGTWWRPQIAVSDIGGSVYGFEIAQAADADHDLTISPGGCPAKNIFMDTAITKQLDVAFAAGDTNGGISDGASDTPAADTTYHIHSIKLDATNVLDVYYDVDKDAANIPAGYSHMCRITSWPTDSSANWVDLTNSGDEFRLADHIEVAHVNPGVSAVTPVLPVPLDIQVLAHISIQAEETLGNTPDIIITSMDQTDATPGSGNATLHVNPKDNNETAALVYSDKLLTDTLGRIRYRTDTTTATLTIYRHISGWTDHRRGLS